MLEMLIVQLAHLLCSPGQGACYGHCRADVALPPSGPVCFLVTRSAYTSVVELAQLWTDLLYSHQHTGMD